MDSLEISIDNIASIIEGHVYRDFIIQTAIKSAPLIMNARKERDVDAKSVTQCRANFIFYERIHRSVGFEDISEQHETGLE